MKGVSRGFTIIEVILFLAISTMLFVIAFRFTNGNIENVRFTDTMRQTNDFLQNQYLAVKNTQVKRPAGLTGSLAATCNAPGLSVAGTSGRCLVLGKLIHFDGGATVFPSSANVATTTIRTFTVISTTAVPPDVTNDMDAFQAADVSVVAMGDGAATDKAVTDEEFTVPWGNRISTQAFRNNNPTLAGARQDFNIIAILRSPISERVYVATFMGGNKYDSVGVGQGWNQQNNSRPDGVHGGGLLFDNTTILSKVFSRSGAPSLVDRPFAICMKTGNAFDDKRGIVQYEGSGVGSFVGSVGGKSDELVGGLTCGY